MPQEVRCERCNKRLSRYESITRKHGAVCYAKYWDKKLVWAYRHACWKHGVVGINF